MSVEFRKDLFANERDDDLNEIGKATRRQDILGHVTGRSPFYDDHQFDGLLHIKCARSPHHHARIRNVDTREAEGMPGVVRIIRGADIPVNLNTLLSLLDFGLDDEPVLAVNKVAYVGEPVVAVVAETEQQAFDAAAKVRVDYEVLPHVLDAEEAVRSGAPTVNETYPDNKFEFHDHFDHQKLRYGDVEKAFARADHIVEGRYQMSPIEQAPIEPNGCIAAPETNDRFVCYTSTQALFFSLGTTAKVLDMQSSRLHFIGGTVGGGFGGKVDTLTEPLAIIAAKLTGRPVRYGFDRQDEMQISAPRGAEVWYLKDAIAADGRIMARKFTGYFDAGAYTRLTSYGVVKCTGHLPGPYTIPNVSSDIYCVFTNRTPATAMRGFGITGVDFAIERHMDKGARAAGMHPAEFRLLNAYRDGDMKAHRRLAKNCALVETIQVAAEKANWQIGEEYRRMTSMTGGGGERALIPETVTDVGIKPAGHTMETETTDIRPGQSTPTMPGFERPAAPAPATPPAGQPTYSGYGASALGGSPTRSASAPEAPQSQPPAQPEPPKADKPAKRQYSRYSSVGRRR